MRLYIDDVRPCPPNFTLARSSDEAIWQITANGWPSFMSLDHDLGGEDTVMLFLHRLVDDIWDGEQPIPEFYVHSANPVGRLNITAFMRSWKKSLDLPPPGDIYGNV